MNYEKLSEHRTVLLDLYKPLEEAFAREDNKEIDLDLKTKQENIEAEKFLVAIVGEVKSGKSTFINALLGEAVLPFDVLQATSEIIEIYTSKKKEVHVTFANGRKVVAEDDLKTPENVVPFLKKIVMVTKEDRGIPIVQVNKFLIEHYNKKVGKAEFKDGEIDRFIADAYLENPLKLDAEEFAVKIREYVKKNISCDEIPQEISLGYPLDFEAKHFRLVDTPGINAIGGIENQTKEFIHQADAVIYLHKAGQQESKALRNALENELPEKVKERLMLILTHRSQHFLSGKCDRIVEKVNDYYPEIGPENIFFVDSMTELHLPKFYEAETMESVNAILDKDGALMDLLSSCFMKARGNLYTFLDLLEEQSNFEAIRNRIEEDAQNSASIQMRDFASDLKEEYEVLDDRVDERIKFLKIKYKDPQSFAMDAKKQIDEMERMKNDYNRVTQELRYKFSTRLVGSEYYEKMEQIVNSFKKKISNKKFGSKKKKKSLSSYVDKLTQNFGGEINRFVDELQADFKKSIQDRYIELQSNYSITVTVPKIATRTTRSIFKNSLKKAKKKRKKKEDEAWWWSPRRRITPMAWKEMKGPILTELHNNAIKVQDEVDRVIKQFLEEYRDEFNGELSRRLQYLDDLKKDKKANEELRDEIAQLEERKRMFSDSIKKCTAIERELG